MSEKIKGRIILCCVYLVAIIAAVWVSAFIACDDPMTQGKLILLKSALSVSVAVAILFTGSLVFNNSSVFDPYWSVVPPLMVIYYLVWVIHEQAFAGAGHFFTLLLGSPRTIILLILTLTYGIRLTWNFLRAWPGMKHEDWRYADFRANTGKAYWIVSFSGIHFFPALMVFGGTLSIWVAVVEGSGQMNLVDILAILLTGNAIFLEAMADKQLRGFLSGNKETGKTMDQGLWSLSRHPNYLGEILFWWGLYLFALAANPLFWWVIIGPMAITLMFIFASIPMIEKRMLKRRKDYHAYRQKVSKLIPWKVLGKHAGR